MLNASGHLMVKAFCFDLEECALLSGRVIQHPHIFFLRKVRRVFLIRPLLSGTKIWSEGQNNPFTIDSQISQDWQHVDEDSLLFEAWPFTFWISRIRDSESVIGSIANKFSSYFCIVLAGLLHCIYKCLNDVHYILHIDVMLGKSCWYASFALKLR